MLTQLIPWSCNRRTKFKFKNHLFLCNFTRNWEKNDKIIKKNCSAKKKRFWKNFYCIFQFISSFQNNFPKWKDTKSSILFQRIDIVCKQKRHLRLQGFFAPNSAFVCNVPWYKYAAIFRCVRYILYWAKER